MKSIILRNKGKKAGKQRGMALLEMIIAIGILGVITAAVVTLASKAFAEQKVKDTVAGITELSTQVKNAYGSDFSNVSTAETDNVISSSLLENPFGGKFNLTSANNSTNSQNSVFIMEIGGLDTDDCKDIASMSKDSFAFVGVMGSAPTDITAAGSGILIKPGDTDASPSEIASACADMTANTLFIGSK